MTTLTSPGARGDGGLLPGITPDAPRQRGMMSSPPGHHPRRGPRGFTHAASLQVVPEGELCRYAGGQLQARTGQQGLLLIAPADASR